MRGIHYTLFLTCAMVATNASSLHAADEPVTVKPTYLEIESADESDSFSKTQTKLKLKVTANAPIAGLLVDGTKLLSFTDSTGADLLAQGIRYRKEQQYVTSELENTIECGPNRGVKINGNEITFAVNVTAVPTSGATTMTIKGQLALQFYPPDGAKVEHSKAINLPKGKGTAKFDNQMVVFRPYGTGSISGKRLTFFQVESSVIIKKISFLDQAGIELANITKFKQDGSLELDEALTDKVAQVQIDYITPVTKITPFALTTGVGF